LNNSIIKEFKKCTNDNKDSDESSISNNLSVLQGLCVIVEKSGCSDLLTGLYDKVFESWSNDIVASIKQQKSNS
jgi:hypothetical protein